MIINVDKLYQFDNMLIMIDTETTKQGGSIMCEGRKLYGSYLCPGNVRACKVCKICDVMASRPIVTIEEAVEIVDNELAPARA